MENRNADRARRGNECGQDLSRQEFALSPVPVKPLVTPELLEQIDLRIGTIESVFDVPNSDKLISLNVNFGDHMRTILAGMKRERADPQEIVGKQALFVVNFPPRRMAGVLSEGMLLDVGYPDGICPVLLVPEKNVPNGTRAG